MTVTDTPSAGSTSDRMQALLSRAVEEQVSEQRAVSTVLAELKEHITALESAVRGAAANESVERLEHSVSTVVADQRTATTLLSQRLEVVAARVEALSALAGRVDAQSTALDEVERALEQFASFPEALSALQRDVSGVHDRLAPLAELRAAMGDLTARTAASLESLRPQLEAIASGAGSTGTPVDPERVRDAVVDALAIRLERLQQAADRPVVGPEVLRSGLGDMRAGVTAAVGQQLDTVQESIAELGARVDRLGERSGGSDAGGEALGSMSAELQALATKIEELASLRAQVAAVAADTRALREDESGTTDAALDALREQLAELTARVAQVPALSVDEISSQVSVRVADKLVETLAPRIADVVLTRVSAALVNQLGQALEPQLRAQTQDAIRQVSSESEARVLAHVDEGMLALAEALLRRTSYRRRSPGAATSAATVGAGAPASSEPVHEILDRLAADESEPSDEAPAPADTRPAVTTGLAPAPVASGVAAPAAKADPASLKDEGAPGLSTAQVPQEVVPAPRAGSSTKPARKAAKQAKPVTKSPAKPAAKAEAEAKPTAKPVAKAAPAKVPAKPPTRKPAAKRPAPKRSATAPAPLLEREVERDHDLAPVRPPAPRPGAAPPPPPPATVLPSAPPPRAREKPKRKPWWRPGG